MAITRRGIVAALGSLTLARAHAEPAFPSRPLTFIIPFPAGGPSDLFGRHLAEQMSPRLGQPIVVENKSGTAGAIMQNLMPKMPYDPAKDLAPQILVVRVQEVLAISAKLGINDLESFIAHAKANPGKITCGSAGPGGITHLAIELFKRETGTDLLHVPYRGAAPAIRDLLAGTVQTVLLDLSVVLPHVRSGAVKVLAVTSDTRAPLLPDVPTMREMGFPKVNSDNWHALISPAASSPRARQKIFDAASEALKTKALVEAYAPVGGVVGGGTSAELAACQREETAKWAAVIKAANIKLE